MSLTLCSQKFFYKVTIVSIVGLDNCSQLARSAEVKKFHLLSYGYPAFESLEERESREVSRCHCLCTRSHLLSSSYDILELHGDMIHTLQRMMGNEGTFLSNENKRSLVCPFIFYKFRFHAPNILMMNLHNSQIHQKYPRAGGCLSFSRNTRILSASTRNL